MRDRYNVDTEGEVFVSMDGFDDARKVIILGRKLVKLAEVEARQKELEKGWPSY